MSTLECLAVVSEDTGGIDMITGEFHQESCSSFGFDSLMCDQKQGGAVSFLCPPSEDEVANVQCLLAEPQNEKLVEVDGRSLELGHQVAFEDFAYSIDCYDYKYDTYDVKMHSEILYSNPLQNGHETSLHFIDSVFQGIEDEADDNNLHMPEHLACSSGLFTGKPSSCYEPSLDCHTQDFDFECPQQSVKTENPGNASAMKSTFIVPKTEFTVGTIDKSVPGVDEMSISELHQMFRTTFGRDTFINDKEWLKRRILFGFGDSNEFNSDPFLLKGGLCEMEDDVVFAFSSDPGFPESLTELTVTQCQQSMVLAEEDALRDIDSGNDVKTAGCFEERGLWNLDWTDKSDECTSRKRLRKPTRRYIEESSVEESRKCHETLPNSVSASRRKKSTISVQKQFCHDSSEVLPLFYKNDSSLDFASQMVSANRTRRGRPRKNPDHMGNGFYKTKKHRPQVSGHTNNCSSVLSEFEPNDDVSDFSDLDDRKIGVRRKHHRLWTLSEVMKLIEGVSRYGVGRWTEIKKYLFYSSTHRTSVDLKDKWRNLLRASGAHIHGKEAHKRKKQISHSIPQAVVLRVRELAVVYPYPRQRETICDAPAAGDLDAEIEN